jgi:hypothetical protein
VGDPEEVLARVKRLWQPGLKLIVGTHVQDPGPSSSFITTSTGFAPERQTVSRMHQGVQKHPAGEDRVGAGG